MFYLLNERRSVEMKANLEIVKFDVADIVTTSIDCDPVSACEDSFE